MYTAIFSKEFKPVHVGVYRTRLVFSNGSKGEWSYSYWNGKNWSDSDSWLVNAHQMKYNFITGSSNKEWYGVTTKTTDHTVDKV
jgi:hypothetical protein